ncbi:MAG: hypothetical protein PWP45_584 [Tepidanaerobacteraceae bacterium]|nr:hypothetical protein [Tepidanaerobacteraceae bacterium]
MAEKKKSALPANWLLLGLIASLYVMGFAVYPRLPDMVPSHWNVSGQVDGYMSKTMHVFFMPTVVLGMYLQKSRQNAPDFNRRMNGGLLFFPGYAKI